MPRNDSHLFGKYLRRWGYPVKMKLKTNQFVKPVPVKAYGRPPSVDSQKGLYHDEDWNFYTKVKRGNVGLGKRGDIRRQKELSKTRRLLRPYVLRKSFWSPGLNYRFKKLKVTLSALDAIERSGGFDEYILRTPPEELRSLFAENMRKLLYWYMEHKKYKSWRLPARLMSQAWAQRDPWYARHYHAIRIARFRKALTKITARHSPFYLPSREKITPERQPFGKDVKPPKLNLWWQETPQIELAFRRRLGEARPFEILQTTASTPGGYRKGNSRGGGGKHGVNPRIKNSDKLNRIFMHGKKY